MAIILTIEFSAKLLDLNVVTLNVILKLKFRKYPLIHINYIISHSTILLYNHNILYDSYAEKKY